MRKLMPTEYHKAAIRRIYEEIINGGDLDVVDVLFDEDYVYHEPGSPSVRGTAGLKHLLSAYRTALPDMAATIEDMIAEGDRVAHRFTLRGTHDGYWVGVPPTGRPVEITGMVVSRFAGGKVVEEWESLDSLGLLQQVGALPTSEELVRGA